MHLVGLITRRSLVRVQPPLPVTIAEKAPIFPKKGSRGLLLTAVLTADSHTKPDPAAADQAVLSVTSAME